VFAAYELRTLYVYVSSKEALDPGRRSEPSRFLP